MERLAVQESSGLVVVSLEGFTQADAQVSCDTTNFIMRETDSGYDGRLSLLVSAYSAQKPIRLGCSECNGRHIGLRSVYRFGNHPTEMPPSLRPSPGL